MNKIQCCCCIEIFLFQMLSLINIVLLFYFSPSLAKVTYCKMIFSLKNQFQNFPFLVNLENTYGPYCNPNSKFTPDAGIVRYAGFVNKKKLLIYVFIFFLII